MEGTLSITLQAIFHETGPCSLQPVDKVRSQDPRALRVHVLFTEMRETMAALRSAATLAAGFAAELALLVPITVPYPLQLDEPPVSLAFVCRRIQELTSTVTVEVGAYIYLCRAPEITIAEVLSPRAIVVLGASSRWPFHKSRRMERSLRRAGHDVVLANLR